MVVDAPEAFFFHFIFKYTFIVLLLVWQKNVLTVTQTN